jgi:hypothetical protein
MYVENRMKGKSIDGHIHYMQEENEVQEDANESQEDEMEVQGDNSDMEP